jgi:tyrosine-protein kinase Etk/Wzc
MNNKTRRLMTKLKVKRNFFIIPLVFVLFVTLIYALNKRPLYQLKTRVKVEYSFGVEPSGNEILSKALTNLNFLDSENPSGSISSLKQSISVRRDAASGLIEISLLGIEPKRMAALANEIADVYVLEVNNKADEMKRGLMRKKELELEEYKKNLKEELALAKERLEESERKMEEISAMEEKGTTALVDLKAELSGLELERANLMRLYTEMHPEVVRVNSQIADFKERIKNIPTEPTGRLGLERELKDRQKTYSTLKGKWDEVNLRKIEELKSIEGAAAVIAYAGVPSLPADLIKKKSIFILGFIIAIIVGALILSASVFLDTALSTPEDLYSYTHLPVVGSLPYVKPRMLEGMKIKDKTSLILGYDERSEIIEPYKLLYAHIQSKIFKDELAGKSLLLTSSIPKEGKTTTAANLALTIARGGKRVLFVDANLVKPSIHLLFGIGVKNPGFTDVLNGGVKLEEATRDVTDILLGNMGLDAALKFKGLDRLKILTVGSPVSDASGLLRSNKMGLLITELKSRFDYIILDSPSVLASADSLILASKVDATFIVYPAGKTPKTRLKTAMLKLSETRPGADGAGTTLKGVILSQCI